MKRVGKKLVASKAGRRRTAARKACWDRAWTATKRTRPEDREVLRVAKYNECLRRAGVKHPGPGFGKPARGRRK